MKTQFTPGPWGAGGFAEHPVIVDSNKSAVASIICHGHSAIRSYPNHIDKANAALIAAAPDMFEALEDAIGFIEDATMSDDELELKHKIIAALAKARGEI